MIHNLKPYPAHKDSGVPWLGEVPEHWEVLPNRAIFEEVKERDFPDEQLLSVTISQGVIQQTDLLANSSKKDSSNEDKTKYKLVKPGDIAYNKMRAWQGAVGVSKYRGIVSPAYVVVHPRGTQNSNYFHYLLRTPAFAKEAERWSYGITSDQWSLRPEHFKMIYCSLPPKDEQFAIVRYLDYIDRRIRHYIRAKKKLIKLLEEQKQAIIHQAVTCGLDPNAKLKPSGVKWLGDVPDHWDLLRLKDAVFQIVDTEHKTAPFYENGNYLVVRTSNVKNGQLSFSDAKYTDEAGFEEWTRRGIPKPGDILFTREAPAGEACLVPEGLPLCLGQRMVLFRVNPEVLDSQFGLYSIYGGAAAEFICQLSLGSTVPHFNMFDIACIPMLLPPIGEQKTIASFLNHESKKISETIDHAHQEISLLREYRTRLIADVVTGKLDVREAAVNLSEETDETESFDDSLAEDEELENNEIEDEKAGEFEEEVLA